MTLSPGTASKTASPSPLASVPSPDDASLRPDTFTLSNGMTVLLQNNDSPVASIYWWIQTGSADEKPAEAGFAHFLEHMHFKDTDAKTSGKASTGEMARAIESLGGDVNAYTSFDQTVYHVTCAAHHWERVIQVFGAMAKPQRFLKDDFVREREVILEELKKNEDSPGRMLFQSLFTNTFPTHPYGKPVIGYVKTLKAAKVADLEAFYRRQYVTGNMGLILVGPYDEKRKKAIIRSLENLFGKKKLKKAPAYVAPRKKETEVRKDAKFAKVPFDVTTPTLAFSFRVPDLKHPDLPALDILAGILGMGETCRLYRALFYGKSLVTDVGGGLYVPRDPGMIYFNADVDSTSKLATVFEGMLDELNRIQTDAPTAEEISRIVTTTESERYYALQSADGIASRIGFLRFQLGDLAYDETYLAALRKVDAAKIQEVALKYFDLRRMAFTLMVPKAEKDFDLKPLFEIAERKIGSNLDQNLADEKYAEEERRKRVARNKNPMDVLPERIELPSGMVVHYRERPWSHVVAIQAAVPGGLRLEVADPVRSADLDLGASNLLSNIWTKGTKRRSAEQITNLIEGAAASVDGFSGRNTIGMSASGLARDWSLLSDLFTECLLEPAFPKEELDLSRKVVEDSIRSIEDHSSALCSKLFHETLFEKHPYGKYSSGTLESVASIDSDRLQAFHRKWLRPDRLSLSIVGRVARPTLDAWLKELDERVSAFAKTAGPAPKHGLDSLGDEPELKGPRWVERKLGREQVHIIVGGLGLRFADEDRHAMRILSNVLGGQSGRLFIELREKKSMAYSVAPITMEGVERGYAGTYIACSPSKKDEAIAGMRKVLEDLVKKGPTEAEMRRAKEYYLGRRAMDLQTDSSLASYYCLEQVYKLPIRSESEIVKRIESVTAKQVREVCRKYFVDAHTVTTVVG
jgi:zinc protease